ncbi:MAG: motility protein A [Firmicutes bacterium]|jgi:chemotaxis protein MotA|nr:motility protein A [Bacillota bacterium]MDH7495391.1 motility protein A [Bacillota bacterium]
MDLTTFIGIVAGLVLVGVAIEVGGSLQSFIDLPSVMITIGGTVAATLISFRLDDIKNVLRVTKVAFTRRPTQLTEVMVQIISLAELARREGLLALDNSLDKVKDDFLRHGLQLVVDGVDATVIREVLETDLDAIEERHKMGRKLFDQMALFAPAFGMIGTLIGLIQMLRNINDPSAIGPGMAVALVTTFYGAMLAYLVFMPISGKLAVRGSEEALEKQILIEGVLAIQSGDNPRIVEEKLRAFLPPATRARVAYKRGVHATGKPGSARATGGPGKETAGAKT